MTQQDQRPGIYYRPSDVGSKWGDTVAECRQMLVPNVVSESPTMISAQVNGVLVDLLFDDHRGLVRIQADLLVSRDFWEGCAPEEYHSVMAQFRDAYEQRRREYAQVLGSPDFQGTWSDAGYPENEIASPIAYWNRGAERIQLEFDHQDKELPIIIRISTYLL